MLSGGERNRLLLAKLFTRPANLLVLDEPTNDLDVETLELLEQTILDFKGTVLLVSHDREFINNIATSTIVLQGEGKVAEYVGGYDDYLHQTTPPDHAHTAAKKATSKTSDTGNSKNAAARKTKLSYKLQRELDALPALIESLETEKNTLAETLSDPATYQLPAVQQATLRDEFAAIDQRLTDAYARWEELEDMN